MFPEFNINIEELEAPTKETLGRCYLFDFKTRRHVISDGKLVECTEQEAIKQWVELLLRTGIEKYAVYKGTWFGLTIDRMIGNKQFPLIMLQAEIEMELKEKLVNHVLIEGMESFRTERLDNGLIIRFKLVLKNGSIQEVTSIVS